MDLRECRKSKQMMQKDVAAKAGISKPFYSLIEGGQRIPSFENAKQLALALDISLDELYEFLILNKN